MITIQILGLDPFVTGHYSKEHSENLAQLFEVEQDALSFFAHEGMVFHNGVEQTSWDCLVIIRAPRECAAFEEAVTDYIFKTLHSFCINISISFDYFDPSSFHQSINHEYPRFIDADHVGGESEEYEEIAEEYNEALEEEEVNPEDPESIYLGNAFDGFEEALEEATKGKK